jgi:F-type H+-transporting ATPase subunit gamma
MTTGKVRQIRRRIRSVDKIRQITRAMELVATSKIKRAEDRIRAAHPYAQKMVEVMQNLSTQAGVLVHPLLEVHEPQVNTGILVLTANRGLCGAFNSSVLRKAEELIREEKANGRNVKILVVGKKGLSYLRYRGYEIVEAYLEISDAPTFEEASRLAQRLMDMYVAKEIDLAYIVFNHFKSVAEQRPVIFKLFPLEKPPVVEEEEKVFREYIFEPSPAEIAGALLPAYAQTVTFRTLLESAESEHGARRTAMKAATDNSGDMIGHLTLSFNRARQAQITQELAEITGTAEALKYAEQH